MQGLVLRSKVFFFCALCLFSLLFPLFVAEAEEASSGDIPDLFGMSTIGRICFMKEMKCCNGWIFSIVK